MSTSSETRTRDDWARAAAQVTPAQGHFIGGRSVPSRSGQTMPCINPATGQTIAQVARGQAQDVDTAVASAQAAWRDGRWRLQSPRQRMAVLQRWADLIEQHAHELAGLV
jgi:gamma-glutamyl-gamma-aminobutyraldehyde dehydrogenase